MHSHKHEITVNNTCELLYAVLYFTKVQRIRCHIVRPLVFLRATFKHLVGTVAVATKDRRQHAM